MKHKLLLLAAMMLATTSLFAQSADNEDEVIKIDKWNQQAYREGEILVKFKADGAVQMHAPLKAKFKTSLVSAIDQLFESIGVDSIEQLMPLTGHKNVGRKLRAYNGSEIEVKDLSKLYRLTLKAEKKHAVHEVIEQLKASDEVEFAEPNYIVYTMALPYDDSIPTMDSATYVNEPLYSQQWGIPAINLLQLWNKPKSSSKRPVIAILDTGVDIEHPDLAANIWTNTTEVNGIADQDDDANGFKDDIHGWDFINQTGNIRDFNGHGTHCAGIAAAVGNNGIGITGANPDALIMSITVMQSNGTGDVATIVKGIDYATSNGADVISMSIGGYQYSIAEEQALGRAYANAVLVAAAGNDHKSINKRKSQMFPAAFSIVLGVEASVNAQGGLAGFSNYDEDGPIYSSFEEDKLYNYELRAPGEQILSTFPGGRYKILNGTSMACPLAAGAISRLIQCKETLSSELLFGDLIHTRKGNIDILSAYYLRDSDRHPELSLVSENLTDTASGDSDYRADAGETIEFYPMFKNAWGQAENIRFWIKAGVEVEGYFIAGDTTKIKILQDTAYLGKPLSSYAKAKSLNPFRVKISSDCPDGANIYLMFYAVCDNMIDTMRQQISLKVENGVEIGGMITENMTLYPNVHYIVTHPLAIPAGVTLTIKPGSTLYFYDNTGISCELSEKWYGNVKYFDPAGSGILCAKGTPDSLIVFTRANNQEGRFSISSSNHIPTNGTVFNDTMRFPTTEPLEYIMYKDMGEWNVVTKQIYLRNSILENVEQGPPRYMEKCQIINSFPPILKSYACWYKYNNFVGNHHGVSTAGVDIVDYLAYSNFIVASQSYQESPWFTAGSETPLILNMPPNYYGSAKENLIRPWFRDIEQNCGYGYYNLSNMLTRPSAEAHGIVWKILIDGIDAQDEFESLPPIGVGQHRCDVYFNRAMDIAVAPTVSFGVRQPYTQHQIAENSFWSADSTIYTAYFTIDAKTVSDGLNRLKVDGAKDNEHFEIPEESCRFNMEIAAAGSMSTGLMAEAGLGKVTLTWETDEEDFADLLGYNIYRWTNDTIWYNYNRNWRIDTLCINSSLIDSQDTAYIDYNVVPGKAYYYVIRQMTTSLDNYDLSNPVTATPLTAIKGDANGSMSVDVADVITEVNYITRQNPQPFIFEAADVNSDNVVNVMDVVATVNLILHPQAQSQAIHDQQAYYYIENGILYVETDVVLGGVQCLFNAEPEHSFVVLNALNGFETVSNWQTENDYLFMAYSMSGKTLEIGKHALLQIGDAELTNIVLSDAQGHNVSAAPRISQDLEGNLFLPCSTKYIQDGHMYIKIGDHIYNAIGTMIK